ncbi:hypothetical protein [Rhizobium sp. K102]|uniref:hypothetical protein n=1 Tax=Rhizobium sp. K102 TaxID=2918527 RepID=UPI001EFA467E|nr:hypothetical protein [Rhizobium sp. K102]ULR44159.1 hypothetical protein MHI61_23930 [Rhizobium sp. K102]
MMMAFDDLFDAALSTILHVSMEMCGGRRNKKRAVHVCFGYEIGKISDNFPFPTSKKHQNHPAGPHFRDFFEESSASLQKISPLREAIHGCQKQSETRKTD